MSLPSPTPHIDPCCKVNDSLIAFHLRRVFFFRFVTFFFVLFGAKTNPMCICDEVAQIFAVSQRNHHQISRNWKHVVASINQLFATRTHNKQIYLAKPRFAVNFCWLRHERSLTNTPHMLRSHISPHSTFLNPPKNCFQHCATTLKAFTKQRRRAGVPSGEEQARPGLSSSDKACPKMELNVKILHGLFI